MESLEKILSDCQSLLDRRGSRIKREARQAATRPDSDSPSMRFEVLVFDTKPKSDLTDTRQPFDRDSQYQSEKKQPRTSNCDARLYFSEAKAHRQTEATEASQAFARTTPLRSSPARNAPVRPEAPDDLGCSSIFIAEDSKLRLSGVNTRSHLEFGASFRLKALQATAGCLAGLAPANQKKQKADRERPELPGMIALEELSRDLLLQSIDKPQQPHRKRNPPASLPQTDPTAAKSFHERFESPERKVVRILQKDSSLEEPASTHHRMTASSKKRDILRSHLAAADPHHPRPPLLAASSTGNQIATQASIKPKRTRPLSVHKERVYDLSLQSVPADRKRPSRKASPSLATTHASIFNLGKMHDYETPHLKQLFAARRVQMVKQLGLRSPDGWPGWTAHPEDKDAFAKSSSNLKAFSEDLDASKHPRLRPDPADLDLCRMEAGEESLGFLIRGNGEKYSFHCKKLF